MKRKRVKKKVAEGDVEPEYDFTGAVRGKYYERFRRGSNVVVLEPDVSAAFPNAEAVNSALRELATVARRSVRVERRSSSPKGRPNEGMQQTRSAPSRKRGPRS